MQYKNGLGEYSLRPFLYLRGLQCCVILYVILGGKWFNLTDELFLLHSRSLE